MHSAALVCCFLFFFSGFPASGGHDIESVLDSHWAGDRDLDVIYPQFTCF